MLSRLKWRKYMEGMDSDIQDLDGLVDEMLTYARLSKARRR